MKLSGDCDQQSQLYPTTQTQVFVAYVCGGQVVPDTDCPPTILSHGHHIGLICEGSEDIITLFAR
jgi:hypothetical protein